MASRPAIRFELSDRIGDVEISPSAVPLGLLKQFSEEVALFIAGSNREVDARALPVRIETGSLVLAIADLGEELGIWGDIEQLLAEDSLQAIDPVRAKVVQTWQQRTRSTPARQYVIGDGRHNSRIAIWEKSSYRFAGSEPWVGAERYLRGTVVDLGGASPNLHLRLEDGSTLTIAATEQQLRDEERNHVYHEVVLRVSLEEHLHSGIRRNARLLEFVRPAPGFDQSALDRFVEQGTEAWKSVEDPVRWVRDQRGH